MAAGDNRAQDDKIELWKYTKTPNRRLVRWNTGIGCRRAWTRGWRFPIVSEGMYALWRSGAGRKFLCQCENTSEPSSPLFFVSFSLLKQ
jgi:hypothetical protein